MKTALITGITGQDGSYLAELLLGKGYQVHGIIRRNSSNFNAERIAHLTQDPKNNNRLTLHTCDLCDPSGIIKVISQVKPDEIYNLGAQTHIKVGLDLPEYTTNVNAIGPLRLLEAIVSLGMEKKVRLVQASAAQMFGETPEAPQTEDTPLCPTNPYSVGKTFAHWTVINYRQSYGIFASTAILYNHDSPRRGTSFVTKKITSSVAKISLGQQEKLELGNLDSKRDWGHAKDYVEGMWRILQQDEPDDFILATGKASSVRDLVEAAFREVGMEIYWEGSGVNEVAKEKKTGIVRVSINPAFFRPNEQASVFRPHSGRWSNQAKQPRFCLEGDFSKTFKKTGWKPSFTFQDMVSDMVKEDLKELGN